MADSLLFDSGKTRRRNMALRVEIPGRLLHLDMIGRGGAGSVRNARVPIEIHHIGVVLKRCVIRLGFPVAFRVMEVVRLLHEFELAFGHRKSRR